MLSLDEMIDRLMRTVTAGLRKPGGEPSSEVHGARCNGKRQEAPSICKVPVAGGLLSMCRLSNMNRPRRQPGSRAGTEQPLPANSSIQRSGADSAAASIRGPLSIRRAQLVAQLRRRHLATICRTRAHALPP